MDESLSVYSGPADQAERAGPAEDTVVEETSAPFVGRWQRLVSTTNWEKGRIISEWRGRLVEAGAPVSAYCDEAWSRRVGNVTPQHVGRLRRVHERFHSVHAQYPGLFWSHFQAALDWHDAEMWLEGAVQSGWSVARMRAERWQAIGSPPDQVPREEEIVHAELDEDCDPADDSAAAAIGESVREVHGLGPESGGEGQASALDAADSGVPWDPPGDIGATPDEAAGVRPFESLPSLPADLADATEAFKLAILHHKLSGWKEVAVGDVLAALDSLRQLALAPGAGTGD